MARRKDRDVTQDVSTTIERMSRPPQEPSPLPKLSTTHPQRVPYKGDDEAVLNLLQAAGKQLDEASGLHLVGEVKVIGPKLTEEQKRSIHRNEQLKHVRSETIKRISRDDEGKLKLNHDGSVATSSDASRCYAWVDATEYHRAMPSLQGMGKTELGALRKLRNNDGGATSLSDDRHRRPSPGGQQSSSVSPIDSMAVRHIIRRQKYQWARRLGWVLVGAAAVAGLFIGAAWIVSRSNAPIHSAAAPAPALPQASAASTSTEEPPVAGPRRQTFAEWQAQSRGLEDPHSEVAPDAGVARIVRRRRP